MLHEHQFEVFENAQARYDKRECPGGELIRRGRAEVCACGAGRFVSVGSRRASGSGISLRRNQQETSMLRMQGTIKSVKVTVSQSGMSRQVTLEIGGDSILDEIQEIMRNKTRLNIALESQQLEIGA
jgi:hypothetical protein